MKARTMVSPDSRIEIGPPIAVGLDRQNGAGERADLVIVVGIAVGHGLDAQLAVGGAPGAGNFRRQVFERHRLRLQKIADVVEVALDRRR